MAEYEAQNVILKDKNGKYLIPFVGHKADRDLANTGMITNCLTEIPQRIKYDLTDGTLTVKAGTVVIVPYGTEDLTAQYPVGATFLNDNFKVYDTQFADGKFFVWAELVGDLVSPATTVTDAQERLVEVRLTTNSFQAVINTISSTAAYTGTGNCTNYRTDLNLVQIYEAGNFTNIVASLPLLKVKANNVNLYSSISQVFNGIGYIGSTIWADKGVKGLIRNKRNDDGTYNNIKHTTSTLVTKTYTSETFNDYPLWVGQDGVIACVPTVTNSIKSGYFGIFEDENIIKDPNNNQVLAFDIGTVSYLSGSIVSFNIKQPFRVPDFQDVVKKSGDTMTGDLKIVETHPIIWLQNTSFDASSTSYESLQYPIAIHGVDKTGDVFGQLLWRGNTDGSINTSVGARKTLNGSDVYAWFTSTIYNDGITNFFAGGKKIVCVDSHKSSANGYLKFTNGYTFQWGYSEATSATRTVTFPTAFGVSNPRIYVTPYSNTSHNSNARAWSSSSTSFSLYCEDGAFWFAIGW